MIFTQKWTAQWRNEQWMKRNAKRKHCRSDFKGKLAQGWLRAEILSGEVMRWQDAQAQPAVQVFAGLEQIFSFPPVVSGQTWETLCGQVPRSYLRKSKN